jgi:membrane protein DedA with SNARE-associated domain
MTIAGTIIWNTILVYLGAAAGASWKRIVAYMDTFSTVVVVLLVITFAILGIIFIKKRLAHKASTKNQT